MRRRRPRNKDWLRLGQTTCGATWHHIAGCVVFHCGHPTALRPYYGKTKAGTHVLNGTVAFTNLFDCQNETLKTQLEETRCKTPSPK